MRIIENAKVTPFGQSIEVGPGKPWHTILAKFNFTNPNHIPPGIHRARNQDNAMLDERHARTAELIGKEDLGVVGRIRKDRVDTGGNFIQNLQTVHAGCLVRGLANMAYGLTQCHWHFKKGESHHKNKFIITVGFNLNKDSVALSRATVEQRRALANICWQWCHGWANPDGLVTLNFGGILPEAKPQHSVIVRESKLTAARITELVTEENE